MSLKADFEGEDKVTIKWRDDTFFVWPGNKIRHVCVVNGVVVPHPRREFRGSTAWALLGRLPANECSLVRDGFTLVTLAKPLLDGLSL